MGLDPKSLPDSFLRRISKEQRKEADLPKTFEEASVEGVRRQEISKLQVPFAQWLCLHKFLFIRPRSDRKSTIQKGWADFTIIRAGRVVAIEFKWPGQSLDPDQIECRRKIEEDGTPYLLAFDVPSAMEFVRKHLGE